jgi:hypothetical protein
MKRTPLKRKTPLRATKPSRLSYTRKTTEQKQRRAIRYEANGELAFPRPMRYVDEPYLEWIRVQTCILKGRAGHSCYGPIAPCHVKTRGSGGGDEQVFPGCATAHAEQEGKTRQFEAKWQISLKERAAWYRAKYERTASQASPH